MAREETINEIGILICAVCREYDEYALKNCGLGYVAPSDCPKAREKVIAILEMMK